MLLNFILNAPHKSGSIIFHTNNRELVLFHSPDVQYEKYDQWRHAIFLNISVVAYFFINKELILVNSLTISGEDMGVHQLH